MRPDVPWPEEAIHPDEVGELILEGAYDEAVQKRAREQATARAVVLAHYWSGNERPYRYHLRTPDTDETVTSSVIEDLCDDAGLEDGDEFVLLAVPTGERPFGDRRVVLTEPHTYERQEANDEA